VLVAEVDDRIVAALDTRSGARVADPFTHTADVLALLQLRGGATAGPPSRRPAAPAAECRTSGCARGLRERPGAHPGRGGGIPQVPARRRGPLPVVGVGRPVGGLRRLGVHLPRHRRDGRDHAAAALGRRPLRDRGPRAHRGARRARGAPSGSTGPPSPAPRSSARC
jgi:hypothetical protein